MDEFEDPSVEYIKGFNQGYLISKEMPEVAGILNSISSQSQIAKGIKAGIEQFQKEQSKDKLPDWMRRDRFNNNKNDVAKDKDDLDKE